MIILADRPVATGRKHQRALDELAGVSERKSVPISASDAGGGRRPALVSMETISSPRCWHPCKPLDTERRLLSVWLWRPLPRARLPSRPTRATEPGARMPS
jgi:hypothetical protein